MKVDVSNKNLNEVRSKYKEREGVELYSQSFASPIELVDPCIRASQQGKYLLGLQDASGVVYKAFAMESNLVAITSKQAGPQKIPRKRGAHKTVQAATVYRYDPNTRTATEVGQQILLKSRNSPEAKQAAACINKEIGLLKSGTIPCTPCLIGTFTYYGKRIQKQAYVTKRFDGDLFDFYDRKLHLNRRICLEALIKVVEILGEWRKKKLVHLDMKVDNFVYRLVGQYDVKFDGTVYKTDTDGTVYKIAKEGTVYQITGDSERLIQKDDIVEIEVCVIDVASVQSADESIKVANWRKDASWTWEYSAPEWVEIISATDLCNHTNQEIANHDVFSVGMIIYFLLGESYHWKHPVLDKLKYAGFSTKEVKEKKRTWEDLNRNEKAYRYETPWQVVSGMLKKDPSQRMLPDQASALLKEGLCQCNVEGRFKSIKQPVCNFFE
ncbi:MAG: Protein kinase domain [Chlamydiota bacterium]|jgi:hypothetical protein